MSHKVVECVPNFSEGRDKAKIKAITDVIEATPGVTLLDVDPGADTNRTVVTFVGSPEAVAEGAFRAIAKASQVINMANHKGAHPRIGATDVCPFVPVSNITLEECAALAHGVGERVGRELGIPVYFYEAAAKIPERKNLAVVRKGEYEGLAEKLADPQWKPDAGPARHNPNAGATVIGAREFLIAYNVTLNTRDKALATDIAFELREKGRVARDSSHSAVYSKGQVLTYRDGAFPCGNCAFVGKTLDETKTHCQSTHDYDLVELLALNDIDAAKGLVGQKVYRAGKFKNAKAIGWYVDQFKRAQISINLTNYKVTSPHVVLEEARRLATLRGLVVTGSEIVGLIPYPALLEAGRYYLKAQGKSPFVPVADILEAAAFSMGLNDVSPFDVRKKVLGLPKEYEKGLVTMSVKDFTDEVSRDTPAPGGGSIAALAGALGASLASMVSNLTQGKTTSADKESALLELAGKAQAIKERLILGVDDDTFAFNAFMDARRLPQNTSEEKAHRQQAMQDGLKAAIDVPFRTALDSFHAIETAWTAAIHGNPASITDAAVGAQMGFAGVRGGIWNVQINLKDITDRSYVTDMQAKCDRLLKDAEELLCKVVKHVDEQVKGMILAKN